MSAERFLKDWHAAVAKRDASLMRAILAPDCELHSPVVWKPTADRDYVLHILQGVVDTIEGFEYRREWIEGDEILLEFTGTVAGKGLVGFDKITLDAEGRMARIEVLIRPMNTLIEFATRMREHALAYAPPAGESV